jgi:hypothetical protein
MFLARHLPINLNISIERAFQGAVRIAIRRALQSTVYTAVSE